MNLLHQEKFINKGCKNLLNLGAAFLFIISFFIHSFSYAAGNCSPYLGQATLNEFFKDQSNMSYDVDDFVEVKILNDTITASIFETWTVQICEDNDAGNNNDADGCSPVLPLIHFTDKSKPWLVMDGAANDGATPTPTNYEVGKYINFKTGFDAILLDNNGDVIDYLSVDGYNPLEKAGCTGAALPFDYQASAPGASDKFIYRTPDGTGDWGSAPSASAPPTEDDTNDTSPDGGTLPIISVANVTVNKGQTATFTFTMDKTVTYAVSVDYKTTGGSAVANTTNPTNYDYTYKTGTITFPANTTTLTTTVDISTNSATPSTTATVFFNFYLFNQVNAKILNAYPIGTILGNATAEWYMDEASWNNTANEVSDISSSANHGTPYGGVSTTFPGKLCNAGSFDGSNDYIEIAHNASLIGTTQLTYSTWINPTSWSSGSINQIMSKSVHGGGAGRAQMGIFSENGRLVGRAETAGGRHEVFSALPTTSNWTYVVLVFNGNSLTLYINGVPATNVSATYPSSKVFNSTTLNTNTDPLMISKRVGSNVYYFHGLIDEVLVMQSALPAGFVKSMYDNYQLGLNWNGATRTCTGALHHFEIDHDGSALTCNPEQVTIRACTNASCTTPHYTTATNITLSPSGWVGGNTQAITGTLSPKLAITTAGTQALNITSSSVTPSSGLSATICKNTSTNTTGVIGSAACNLTFSDSGFIFSNDTDSNLIVPTQLSGKNSNIGYNAKTITLQAVKKSDNIPTQCVSAFQNKTLNIDFAAECRNPTTCIAGQPLTLNGSTLLTTDDDGTANSSSYDTRSITFDANGKYNIVFNYPEAGLMELHARHNILSADGSTPSGQYMTGSSSFVVRPLGLSLDVSGQRAADYINNGSLDDSTGTDLSYAADANGSFFQKAGDDFVLTLSAVQWQAADDANNDGIADTGANLTNNTVTKNFGNETTPVTPANIVLVPTTSLPNTGTIANSANSASFANGVGTKTISYSEVGIVDITSTLSNYIAAGITITNKASSFGRFSPHHFDTVVTHGCNNIFTYSGQPFTATVTAKNKANTTTLNYRDTYGYGVTLSDANTASPALGTFSNATIASASFSSNTAANGSSYGAGVQSSLTYTFNTKDTIPETLEIRATDITDTAVTSNGYSEDTTNIRSGRMRLENVYGPELTPLTMPVKVEYYSDNGTATTTDDGYVTSTDDSSCSTYDAPNGTLGSFTGNLSNTPTAEIAVTGTSSVTSGVGNITFHKPGDITLGPGAGNEGSVNLLLNNISNWLTYNWGKDCDGDAANDTGACGTASFGLYRGDDRIIYWREVF